MRQRRVEAERNQRRPARVAAHSAGADDRGAERSNRRGVAGSDRDERPLPACRADAPPLALPDTLFSAAALRLLATNRLAQHHAFADLAAQLARGAADFGGAPPPRARKKPAAARKRAPPKENAAMPPPPPRRNAGRAARAVRPIADATPPDDDDDWAPAKARL